MLEKKLKAKILFLFLAFLVLPSLVKADSLGERRDFFVDSSFDAFSRTSISATLLEKSSQVYFYIDDGWWGKFGTAKQDEIKTGLNSLSGEFENRIYPVLTGTFGSEWKPGIDKDERITVLLHPLKEGARGYYRTTDEYFRIQAPTSNEREMVYLNANYITDGLAKSYLTHEFQHLISFNQKEKRTGTGEEVWLQEAISEYVSTLLGYDNPFTGSNLESRVQTFLRRPSDSLTEWPGTSDDYGALNIFTQYLVDNYGLDVLVGALKSEQTGILALNEALIESGFSKDFGQVFREWTLTVLINDCSLADKYCYKNEILAGIKVVPSLNFLPFVSKATLRIEDGIKDWSGRWYKLVGGKGNLTLDFDGIDEVQFFVSYWACKNSGECTLGNLGLNEKQEGTISFSNFGSDYSFLTIILSTQEKLTDFGQSESSHPFSLSVLVNEEVNEEKENDELIQQLLDKIEFLKAEIAKVQVKIDAILAERAKKVSRQSFERNLSYGMEGSEVSCLQEFLKAQGGEIYPEGLVTGYFGSLTQAAVIRFQEKNSESILKPLGLVSGTGFVGQSTRNKINELIR